MHNLNLDRVFETLVDQVERRLDNQVVDPDRPNCGAFMNPQLGVADAGSTVLLVAGCAILYSVARGSLSGSGAEALAGQRPLNVLRLKPRFQEWFEAHGDLWLERARLGADYLLRAQRPNGLIDLVTCNYDSSPDTGFAVQRLCPAIALGRLLAVCDPAWAVVLDKVETFVRRSVPGMASGGFHTPNHRWVIASALAWAGALFPDLAVQAAVDAYLAEGFDVDAEGAFIERSVGVYDAVCDRSLLLLHDLLGNDEALAAAEANLEFDLYLLNGDGTAETGLSRRQDYGTRRVPLCLAAPYLLAARATGRTAFAQAAQWLWQKVDAPGLDDLNWLCYALLKGGEPAAADGSSLPVDYIRHFPANGIWRVRRGEQSLCLFQGATRLLVLRHGEAELSAVKISQSYFGVGRFVGDSLAVEGDVAVLRSEGLSRPHRPGYDLPLGRRVQPDEWRGVAGQRPYRPLPPCTSALAVQPVEGGFSLRYQTVDGMDGVTAQVAFDFPPGGVWESDDVCLRPQGGQVLFLKRGYGTMRYGNDTIRIGPGADAHRIWQMRDSEPAPEHVRVLVTFHTPVDHVFEVQTGHGVT